ncbi:DUF4244 domain-containing protein [Salinactinospora qingdaonensis]|uniref:DUF4244 domain-containing protein n=1 Tax=Salinactinospora qingdaonensis TaxID=702744 RepID=A0ABP7F4Q0_9ACTN
MSLIHAVRASTGRVFHTLWAGRAASENGMSTAEYALGTVAACAFAAVLYAVLTSSEVRETITSLVTNALQVGG